MRRMMLSLALGALVASGWIGATPTFGQDQAELQQLKQQVEELQNRIQQLEDAAAKQKEADAKKEQPVTVATKGSKIKVDGRIFAGVVDTGSSGAFPNRSVDIPDAKLRFTFSPAKDVVIVNRFSTSRAATSGFDYFYLDLNNFLGAAGRTFRLGKMKIDVGEETWTDNPVENILITNSVSHVSGYDEGVNLRGPLGAGSRPAAYSLAVLNGNKDFVASNSGLAWAAKIGGAPTDRVYVSASYLQTGALVRRDGTLDKPDFRVAEITDAPSGATTWKRKLWEVDARWNYGPTGIKPTITSDPAVRSQLAAAYGGFTDEASPVADREGTFWFVEGLHNLTPRVFLASRLSEVELDGSATAKLGDSPAPVNEYRRFSLGLGYRLSPLTQLKAEWTRNRTSGGASDPDLDQLAVGVAAKF